MIACQQRADHLRWSGPTQTGPKGRRAGRAAPAQLVNPDTRLHLGWLSPCRCRCRLRLLTRPPRRPNTSRQTDPMFGEVTAHRRLHLGYAPERPEGGRREGVNQTTTCSADLEHERRPLRLQLNETMGDGTQDGSGGLSRATSTSNCQTSSTTSPTTMGGSTASSSHTMTGTQHHGEVGVHRGLLEVVPYPRGTPHRVLLSTRTRQIALVVTPPEEPPSTETDISKSALDIENLDPDAILLWIERGTSGGNPRQGAHRIEDR